MINDTSLLSKGQYAPSKFGARLTNETGEKNE
jgi:hypothetical protein